MFPPFSPSPCRRPPPPPPLRPLRPRRRPRRRARAPAGPGAIASRPARRADAFGRDPHALVTDAFGHSRAGKMRSAQRSPPSRRAEVARLNIERLRSGRPALFLLYVERERGQGAGRAQ